MLTMLFKHLVIGICSSMLLMVFAAPTPSSEVTAVLDKEPPWLDHRPHDETCGYCHVRPTYGGMGPLSCSVFIYLSDLPRTNTDTIEVNAATMSEGVGTWTQLELVLLRRAEWTNKMRSFQATGRTVMFWRRAGSRKSGLDKK